MNGFRSQTDAFLIHRAGWEGASMEWASLIRWTFARQRAGLLLDRCIANGTAHVRSHVDMHLEMGLAPLHEILAAREDYQGRITIEIVAFPQGGVMRCPNVIDLMDAALDAGADLVGGIDPSVIDRDPRGQLDAIFALADRRGSSRYSSARAWRAWPFQRRRDLRANASARPWRQGDDQPCLLPRYGAGARGAERSRASWPSGRRDRHSWCRR